ncbi:hypothetical protein Y032_0008g209 [Ancylostoma ceylanicum]|uniref:Uncharacterized protein n=1 Tax=Ancylostoma ceylanicum TaxID=53326 RepID=A0A016VM37_9BILA|nr:hypothetical protein Y032_0008g209 [Ancylostoma ceylanicum]
MGSCCSHFKKKEVDLTHSDSFVHKITYDCKGFGLHDMALLNKRHDPQGGASYAKYRYYGDVQIISTERLFKLMEMPRDESFSLNANIDVQDVFRILFVKDFDDPFYLRLLETMMPIDDIDSPDNTQAGSIERAQLLDPQKSTKQGSISEKKSSIKNNTPLEIPQPLAKKLKEKLQNDKKNVENNKDEKAVNTKKADAAQRSDFLRTRTTQGSELVDNARSSTKKRRDRSLEEEEVLRTEPTMPDDYG